MKNFILALALCLSAPVFADQAGFDMSGTSPSTVTTAVGYTTVAEVGMFQTCSFYAVLQGGTGGTLDVYVQTAYKKVNATPTWMDVAHFPQLAGGAAAVAYAFTLTRWAPAAPVFTTTINTVSGTPVIAVNTIVPGALGYLLRIVYKTGAGTTVGAAQSILTYCSGS